MKNRNQILRKEVKQLKRKVKTILKVDNEIYMDAIVSSKCLEVEKKEKPSTKDVQTKEKETMTKTIELTTSSIQIQMSKKISIDTINVKF